MSVTQQLEKLIAEYEARGGEIPRIASVDALFAEYHLLALPRAGLPIYVLALAIRRYMPVRLPDGTLGFLLTEPQITPAPSTQTRQ
jgi:hypothetical protein